MGSSVPHGWTIKQIGEIAKIVGGGTPSTSDPSNFEDGKISWITPKDLSGYVFRRISRGERNITDKGLATSSAKLVPAGTVLLTTRAPIGYVAIADKPLATNQGFRSLVLKNGYDSEFIFHLLKTQTETLKANAGGTTYGELAGSTLKQIEVLLPPLPEQRRIAEILGALDDKIELNMRMNKTLEAMAAAIFKSWFIDFEPFQDGEFIDSELGPIPKGWEIQTIGSLGTVICGKTPPTSDLNNYGDDYLFITIPDMHGNVFVIETSKRLSEKGAQTQPKKELPPLSVCVSCIATPGLVSLTSAPSHTNQQINSIICKEDVNPFYVFQMMRHLSTDILTLGSGGTATLNLNKANFSKIKIIVPEPEKMKMFHETVEPIFKLILKNQVESRALAQVRDTLLPKLLSGKIDVSSLNL